jgi:hypothetical protein
MLGPYETTIDSYISVDVDGYKNPETIGFSVPDTADSFLQEVGALDLEIDVSSVNIKVKWSAEFEERSWGIKDTYINILEVSGIITFNVIVPDPLDDEKWEEYEHEYEFSWNEKDEDFWDNVEADISGSPIGGFAPSGLEIVLDSKKTKVIFE